jgi:amidophosphoribosyltransferase
VLLNVLADEVHRAHQRCLQTTGCDPNRNKMEFLFEAGATAMKLLQVGRVVCLVFLSLLDVVERGLLCLRRVPLL